MSVGLQQHDTMRPRRTRGKPTDDGDFVVFEAVPIFDTHIGDDGVEYTPQLLQRIANNCNKRISSSGDWCPIVVGHTRDKEEKRSATDDPPVIGLAGPFWVGTFGNDNPRACIMANFWIFPEFEQTFLRNPRRSVEVWPEEKPEDRYFDPISLLGAETPKRDLGMIYSRSRAGTVQTYAVPGPLRYAKRYRADMPIRYQEGSVAGPTTTFIPSGGGVGKGKPKKGVVTLPSDDEMKPQKNAQQESLFGDIKPKPQPIKVKSNTGKQESLFPKAGKPGQMNLFKDKAVPDSLLPKEQRSSEPEKDAKQEAPVNPHMQSFRDRRQIDLPKPKPQSVLGQIGAKVKSALSPTQSHEVFKLAMNEEGDQRMFAPDELQQLLEALMPAIEAKIDDRLTAVQSSEPSVEEEPEMPAEEPGLGGPPPVGAEGMPSEGAAPVGAGAPPEVAGELPPEAAAGAPPELPPEEAAGGEMPPELGAEAEAVPPPEGEEEGPPPEVAGEAEEEEGEEPAMVPPEGEEEEDQDDEDEEDKLYGKALGRKFMKYAKGEGEWDEEGAEKFAKSLDEDDQMHLGRYMKYRCDDEKAKEKYWNYASATRHAPAASAASSLKGDMSKPFPPPYKQPVQPPKPPSLTDPTGKPAKQNITTTGFGHAGGLGPAFNKPGEPARYAEGENPSDDVSASKAKKILEDGEVHGKPLTDKQKGMFGAAAGKYAKDDLPIRYRKLCGEHDELKQRYAKAQQELTELRVKERYAKRFAIFKDLESQGYVLDPEEELALTEDLNDDQFDRHVQHVIPTRYNKVSGSTFAADAAFHEPSLFAAEKPQRYAKQARALVEKIRRTGKRIEYKDVLDHLVTHEGDESELVHEGNGRH